MILLSNCEEDVIIGVGIALALFWDWREFEEADMGIAAEAAGKELFVLELLPVEPY